MKNVWMWIVVLVLALAGGYVWWQGSQKNGAEAEKPTVDVATELLAKPELAASSTDSVVSTSTDTAAAGKSVTVTMTDAGFTPTEITITKGTAVTFVNKAAGPMWVASGPHPAHTGYDTTNKDEHCAQGYSGQAAFDQCATGSTYTFTFEKTGTWPYHDHAIKGIYGKVIVK